MCTVHLCTSPLDHIKEEMQQMRSTVDRLGNIIEQMQEERQNANDA